MPRGSKAKYTDKQKRQAADIENSYKDRGVPAEEAEARAWATVNKQSGGGERPGGSGRKKPASAKAEDRQDSAERAAATRKAHDSSSLAEQNKQSLLRQARSKHIHGRSTMNKQELIEALQDAS
nr:termination factor Rho [uncultured Pseudomonas sp.]